jgi:hypothetical protein
LIQIEVKNYKVTYIIMHPIISHFSGLKYDEIWWNMGVSHLNPIYNYIIGFRFPWNIGVWKIKAISNPPDAPFHELRVTFLSGGTQRWICWHASLRMTQRSDLWHKTGDPKRGWIIPKSEN